jgi:glycosyltransferase involved in cell wall biosynthesis
MERRIYRAAARVIGLAPGIVDGVCRTGYPAERVLLIPNGCDLELFQPSDARLDDTRFGDPGELRLAFTGAHGPANGLDAVIDAAAELARRGETGIRFLMVGDGACKPQLSARAAMLGLTSISWIDPIPKLELGQLLPRIDVGMQLLADIPAFYRGTSPNKFFDYIAAGIPVLNNYPGWLAEMIEQHACGVVVPPGDPAAFADAVVTLRDDPQGRRRMGSAARTLAESRFARDALSARFIDCLLQATIDRS